MCVVVLLGGCQTPYQTMGFTGGVEATPLGNGAYVVHSMVNGYTSQGIAVEHAYRRASELCPQGFQLADSATSSTSSYWRTQYGVQEVNKPEVTIVVQCNHPAPPPRPPAAAPASTQAAEYVRWWCVTFSGGRLGGCYRDKAWCEKSRANAAQSDASTSACQPQRTAECFGIAYAGQIGTDDLCQPSREACGYQRDFTVQRPDMATVLTECRTID